MSRKKIHEKISEITFKSVNASSNNIHDYIESVLDTLRQISDEIDNLPPGRYKYDCHIAILEKLNQLLLTCGLNNPTYYPFEWDASKSDDGIDSDLIDLGMDCSIFANQHNKDLITNILDGALDFQVLQLETEIASLKKHGMKLLQKNDKKAIDKGSEILKRANMLKLINCQRRERNKDELYGLDLNGNNLTTKDRQCDFANQVNNILYPKGKDVLASHRGYKNIAAHIANIVALPLGVVKGFYTLAKHGNPNMFLFSTKTTSEKLLANTAKTVSQNP